MECPGDPALFGGGILGEFLCRWDIPPDRIPTLYEARDFVLGSSVDIKISSLGIGMATAEPNPTDTSIKGAPSDSEIPKFPSNYINHHLTAKIKSPTQSLG